MMVAIHKACRYGHHHLRIRRKQCLSPVLSITFATRTAPYIIPMPGTDLRVHGLARQDNEPSHWTALEPRLWSMVIVFSVPILPVTKTWITHTRITNTTLT